MWVDGKQVHVNALCTSAPIDGGEFPSAAFALAEAVRSVVVQGGVALINHPIFDWALGRDDVLAVAGTAALLEIASGPPYVHAAGDRIHPSHEALWDAALTAGRDVMGVGVDDVHHVRASDDPPAFPGAAWVEVFTADARPDAICRALARGDLYASTGPSLHRVRIVGDEYLVDLGDQLARVSFVGNRGHILATRANARGVVRYQARGDEGYVRCRIESSQGTAWTPAVRVVPE